MNLEMEHIVAAVIFAGVAVTTFIWALKKELFSIWLFCLQLR